MKYMEIGKQLCLERDAFRCKQCSSESNSVRQISKIDGRFGWHLSNLSTLCDDCFHEAELARNSSSDNRVGVILAGGSGTRLFPLSYYTNKHCLPLAINPLIFYVTRTIRKFGVKRIIIVSTISGVAEISNMLGSGKEWGVEIAYVVQQGAFGIANALGSIKGFVMPTDKIICILGDNIFDNNELDTDIDLDNNKACIYLKKVSNPQDYGVAEIKDDKIERIIEKPKDFIGDMAVVGLYAYTYDVFDVIDSIKPSARGETEISSVNDYFVSSGEIQHKIVNGYWNDAGSSLNKYLECFLYGAKQSNVSSKEIDNFRSIVFDDK